MPEDLILAEIQQAFFEYRGNFKEPITVLWTGGRHAEVIDTVHKALSPWGVGFENIAWQQGPKNLGELQLTFGVPSLFASVQVGIAGVTMTALNPDWSRAPILIAMFQAALTALRGGTGQELRVQQTTLGLHLKPPDGRPFREIIKQFVSAKSLGGDDATMFGVSLYHSDYSLVIDASVAIPGGLFIKLVRNFASEKHVEEIAKAVYSDEEAVLRQLGLKLQ
jgi:hypothetical protein